MSEKTFMAKGSGGGFLTAAAIAQLDDCSVRTVANRVAAMKKHIGGRYGRYVILDGKRTKVNLYAYRDFEKYEKILETPGMGADIPPFRPLEMSELCPVAVKVVTMADERRQGGKENDGEGLA